jgi:uncharacterized membrane protein
VRLPGHRNEWNGLNYDASLAICLSFGYGLSNREAMMLSVCPIAFIFLSIVLLIRPVSLKVRNSEIESRLDQSLYTVVGFYMVCIALPPLASP